MRQFLKVAVWGCVALIFLCSPTRGADPAAQGASTKPSAVVFDLTDPKKAYESMAAAVLAEDPAQVKACLYFPNASDGPMIDAVIENQIVQHQVGTIILNRFGADGKRLLDSTEPLTFDDDARELLGKIAAVPAVINGDKATLKSDAEPMRGMEISMRRVDGKWKLDMGDFLGMMGQDRANFLTELNGRSALLLKWSAEIKKGAYKDVDDAKAGMALLEYSTNVNAAVATSLPANRWKDKAAAPGLTDLQKLAYEQLAQLQDCNLQQMSVPGSPMLDAPAPGTTEATVTLLEMGLDAVPILAEALDDTTPTKTSEFSGRMVVPGTSKKYWTVNQVVARLIEQICERGFAIGKEPNAHGLEEVARDPKLAPEFKKAILDWYSAHRNQTEVDRKLFDLTDDGSGNRLDAVEWLGSHKVVKAAPAICQYIDQTLATIKKYDPIKEAEISKYALALGQIGAKENLPKVQQVCQHLSAGWDERQGGDYLDINSIFQAYHGLALLGEKDAAIKELTRLYERYHDKRPDSSDDFKRNLDEAGRW